MSDITPLTPAEVDTQELYALEGDANLGAGLSPQERRWLATVRDRERQRDEAIQESLRYESQIAEVCPEDRSLKETFAILRRERDELPRQLAEFKNGNAYSKLGGQLAEVSQERHRLERALAEARKVLAQAATMDLTSYASTSAAKDAARKRVTPTAASSPAVSPEGTTQNENPFRKA